MNTNTYDTYKMDNKSACEYIKKLMDHQIKYLEGTESTPLEFRVKGKQHWHQECDLGFNFQNYEYRVPPKLVPWEMDDVPIGALLKESNGGKRFLGTIVGKGEDNGFPAFFFSKGCAVIDGVQAKYCSDALTNIYKLVYSTDEGITWNPCGKFVE
jgi:hypothetical protein